MLTIEEYFVCDCIWQARTSFNLVDKIDFSITIHSTISMSQYSTYPEFARGFATGFCFSLPIFYVYRIQVFFAVMFVVCRHINTRWVSIFFPLFWFVWKVILPFCIPSTRTQEICLVTQHTRDSFGWMSNLWFVLNSEGRLCVIIMIQTWRIVRTVSKEEKRQYLQELLKQRNMTNKATHFPHLIADCLE